MTTDPIATIAIFFLAFLAFCVIGAIWNTWTDWVDLDQRRRENRRIQRTLNRIIDTYGYPELRESCPDALPEHWRNAA